MNSSVTDRLPRSVLDLLKFLRSRWSVHKEFRTDRRRYVRHAAPGDYATPRLGMRNVEAQLIKDYHRIEKGLALREPKRPFGDAVLARLDSLLPRAAREDGDAVYISYAESARTALRSWNVSGSIDEEVSPRNDFVREHVDYGSFFKSRRSVRDFSDRPVAASCLQEAVALATNSPSVCNRQGWNVRFVRGEDAVRALAYQNGNAGFGHQVPVLAIVTTDLRLFGAATERNQAWIEGGIFSMSFVWALHSMGLDSCMLNMSVSNRRADELRSEFEIPDHELVVMMIAIGYGREGGRRARSPRRPTEDVIIGSIPEAL